MAEKSITSLPDKRNWKVEDYLENDPDGLERMAKEKWSFADFSEYAPGVLAQIKELDKPLYYQMKRETEILPRCDRRNWTLEDYYSLDREYYSHIYNYFTYKDFNVKAPECIIQIAVKNKWLFAELKNSNKTIGQIIP